MTNILQRSSTTSSNPNHISPLDQQLLASNSKCSVTIFVQPPSSHYNQPSTLLLKRLNPVDLGDSLMKKIKSKATNSDDNCSQQGSSFEGNSYNSPNSSRVLENLESSPIVEDMNSPSIKSSSEDFEIPKLALPQRSPLTPTKLTVKTLKVPAKDNHRQVQNALEALQHKILLNQVASLREVLFRGQAAQEPLSIPPLMSPANSSQVQENKFFFDNDEDQPKVIIGPVEYPLLAMAPPEFCNESQKNLLKVPGSLMLSNNAKYQSNKSMLESLCVTRAETQRSESDGSSCVLGEELLPILEGRKKRTKREVTEKVKKTQKRQTKGKGKQRKNESDFSVSSESP